MILDGTDILGFDAEALQALRGATVAYVPQDPASALNPALRIGNQLREAMKVHPGAVDDVDLRVAQVLEDASLANDILNRTPTNSPAVNSNASHWPWHFPAGRH